MRAALASLGLIVLSGMGVASSSQDLQSGLEGHWTFDEVKEDNTSPDTSDKGGHAKLVGAPTLVEGKIGKALSFDGKGGYVELPNAEHLKKLQEGSYSLAAWFKPEDVPPGQDVANDAQYAIVIKTGWHTGIHYGNDRKFAMEHWIQTEDPQQPKAASAGTWSEEFEPGQWYHLVGVVDRKACEMRLYINGELKNTGAPFGAEAKAHDYGDTTWKIGIGGPGSEKWAWAAKGVIDDVRFYSRALGDQEVQALAKAEAK